MFINENQKKFSFMLGFLTWELDIRIRTWYSKGKFSENTNKSEG